MACACMNDFYKTAIISMVLGLIISTGTYAQALDIYCEDYKPTQFVGPDGELDGMAVRIVREIQRRVGNSDVIRMVPWARGLNELNSRPNVILFSMTRTADRNPLYQWIGPIAETARGFYAKIDSKIEIKSLDDARKLKSIGVYRGDAADQFLTQAGFKNLDITRDQTLNWKKLFSDRFDVIASSPDSVNAHTAAVGHTKAEVKLLYVFMGGRVYIAASKGTPVGLVEKWNSALRAMKKDGSFEKIFKEYYPGLDLPGPPDTYH